MISALINCEDEQNPVPAAPAEVRNLLGLPELPIVKILSYVDVPSLKNLRLVSRTTKCLVEQPFFFKRIKFCTSLALQHRTTFDDVKRYFQLNTILESSTTKWSNIAVTFECCKHPAMIPFLRNCKSALRRLQICDTGESNSFTLMPLLLNLGPKLESLTFVYFRSELNLPATCPQIWESGNRENNHWHNEVIMKNMAGIRHLHFDLQLKIWTGDCGEVAKLVKDFLTFCPHLETLTLPSVRTPKDPTLEDSGFAEILISHLQELTLCSGRPCSLKQIIFGNREKFYNELSENLPSIFTPTCQQMPKLLKLCDELKIQLVGISSTALPTIGWNPGNVSLYDKCIRSIFCHLEINEHHDGIGNFYIPQNCEIVLWVYNDTPWRNSFSLQLPTTLNITKLHVDIRHDITSPASRELTYQLLFLRRPSVVELVFYGNEPALDALGFRLSGSFPNLKRFLWLGNKLAPHRHLPINLDNLLFGWHNTLEELSLLDLNLDECDLCNLDHRLKKKFKKLVHLDFKICCSHFRCPSDEVGNSFIFGSGHAASDSSDWGP